MDLDPLRVLERLHGHAGWLGAALLVHPAIILRDRRRRANVAVALSTGLITVIAGVGMWLYVSYREQLKRQIFIDDASAGWLFERKEHLAFGAVVLAWAGGAAYFTAERADAHRDALRTTAHRAFVASAALALTVAALGTYVAIVRSF